MAPNAGGASIATVAASRSARMALTHLQCWTGTLLSVSGRSMAQVRSLRSAATVRSSTGQCQPSSEHSLNGRASPLDYTEPAVVLLEPRHLLRPTDLQRDACQRPNRHRRRHPDFAVGPNKDGSGIDLSKYTTCSRGQHGVNLTRMGNDPDQGTDGNAGPRHEDVYVQNGATNRAGATVLNDGHVDVASRLRAGTLDTVVKDTTASSKPTWRDLRGTVLQLLPESKATVPTGYDFLGKAGSPVGKSNRRSNLICSGRGGPPSRFPRTRRRGASRGH